MYVAVKGGERAVDNAHALLAEKRRGDTAIAELGIAQIRNQLSLVINRVVAEGSLYDPDLAALAIKRAQGDLIEAIFLIRAYRTTLPRFAASDPLETAKMACIRRVSATFKDAPGGQVLSPTFDYTHRLLDFKLMADGDVPAAEEGDPRADATPHIMEFLNVEGLIQQEAACDDTPGGLTREPLELPAARPLRLQFQTRGDEGFILSMAYSTQRRYARTHASVGELRIGTVPVEMDIPELGFAIEIGEIEVSECETINQFKGSKSEPRQFTRGYGLVFWSVRTQGHCNGPVGSRPAVEGIGGGRCRGACTGRGICAPSRGQYRGDGFSGADQIAALRGFLGRVGVGAQDAC